MRAPGRCLAIAIALLAAAASPAQTYYKWVDAQGATHYGDKPPAGLKTRRIELHGAAAAASAAAPPTALPPVADTSAAEHAYQARNCASARNDLKLLASHAVLVNAGTLGAPAGVGEATKLSPAQREAARADAEKRVHDFCGQG